MVWTSSNTVTGSMGTPAKANAGNGTPSQPGETWRVPTANCASSHRLSGLFISTITY